MRLHTPYVENRAPLGPSLGVLRVGALRLSLARLLQASELVTFEIIAASRWQEKQPQQTRHTGGDAGDTGEEAPSVTKERATEGGGEGRERNHTGTPYVPHEHPLPPITRHPLFPPHTHWLESERR